MRATAEWCVDTERWAELAAMCQHLWYFLVQAAPVDAAAWFQHSVDHDSALGDQAFIDCLGLLAWIHVGNFANYAEAAALGERSHTRAAALQVPVTPWASLAMAMTEVMTGRNTEALRLSEFAIAEAEARNDEQAAAIAMCNEAGALAALGERERSIDAAAEALRRANATGSPLALSAAVISAAGAHLQQNHEPGFAASFDILSRHNIGLTSGDLNGMWLDIQWGFTLLGLDRPGALGLLSRAARTADRLNSPHVLDYALRLLAIIAAEASLAEQAAALIEYAEANLRPHRIENPSQTWIQARLDAALGGLPEPAPEPRLHRGEIMALVTEIETSLTRDEPASRSASD